MIIHQSHGQKDCRRFGMTLKGIGMHRMTLPRTCHQNRAIGCMHICIARKAINSTPVIGTEGQAGPIPALPWMKNLNFWWNMS